MTQRFRMTAYALTYLLIALILGWNVARAYQTETPRLGDLFTPIEVSTSIRYERHTSTDAGLMRDLMLWQFEIGWTEDWYNGDPPITREIERQIRFETSDEKEGRVYMLVFGSRFDADVVYPAIYSYQRLFGDHSDPDLRNHPDLGWWAMRRADMDALLEELQDS